MEISKDDKTALVFKSSHIAAQAVIKRLLVHNSYKRILLFDDKMPTLKHEKVECFLFDPDTLEAVPKGDDLYCFYDIEQAKKHLSDIKISQLYSFQIAKMAALNDVSQFFLFSSTNSSTTSMNFNSRIRAALEDSINALPFWSVHTFRPSAVVNTENKSRWGEKIANRMGKGLDRVTGGLVSKYRPVEAALVAKSMLEAAQQLKPGRFVYHPSYFVDMEEKEQGLRKQ